jgi:hypothetical protein
MEGRGNHVVKRDDRPTENESQNGASRGDEGEEGTGLEGWK